MTLGANGQISKISINDDHIDFQELSNVFINILKRQKSINKKITSIRLYNLAIDQWQQGKLKSKPFIQLVKSWVILATERGLVKKYSKDNKEIIEIAS